MTVLIACEVSGRVRDAFIKSGITYQGIADAMAEQWSPLIN